MADYCAEGVECSRGTEVITYPECALSLACGVSLSSVSERGPCADWLGDGATCTDLVSDRLRVEGLFLVVD